jgi:chromosome segregation ATPase
MMDDATPAAGAALDADLAAARARLAEARRAATLVPVLQAQVAEYTARCAALGQSLLDEQRDVDRLEGLSLTRVVLAMSGHAGDRLEKERAERDAATLRLRSEQAALANLQRQFDATRAMAARLESAETAYATAMSRRRAALEAAGDERVSTLHELDAQLTEFAHRHKEIAEAQTAAQAAIGALESMGGYLDSSKTWSTLDLVRGGTLTSMMKHSRLDDAARAAQRAQRALDELGRELRDVYVARAALPNITSGQRIIDVWFDNVFTDWSVNRKIRDSQAAVDELLGRVRAVQNELMRRAQHLDGLAAETTARRTALLDPAAG